jgi:asparagine synthetase B (glutamine-hydrolysing)
MLDRLLTVDNFYWSDDRFQPDLALHGFAPAPENAPPATVRGRFACAFETPDGGVTLARDRLGLNKLFLAVHESGTVVGANYLIDLVNREVPFECIQSVPAGHQLHIDPVRDVRELTAYAATHPGPAGQDAAIEDVARSIRSGLERWFARLAAQFRGRRICVCLSGGIDSGVIAALATHYFPDVVAYTYMFADAPARSEDAVNAERVAEALRIPLRIVPASTMNILDVMDDAICYGQDWRDFNVHCAIVNELLARAIAGDLDRDLRRPALVLTGDLANEFLADYSPVKYRGREFYSLPHLDHGSLRQALIRGLDAGDREVGVFNHHGLDVIQPYGFLIDEFMALPGSALARDGFKQSLAHAVAGDLLPPLVLSRRKVRAQIGGATPTGILPVLLENGYDLPALRAAFCRLFMIEDESSLESFIRAGRYRVVRDRPGKRRVINGYIAA